MQPPTATGTPSASLTPSASPSGAGTPSPSPTPSPTRLGCAQLGGCLVPMLQLGLPVTASGSVVSLGARSAAPVNAVAAWGVLWTPLTVLLPGSPALGERVEATCAPVGANASALLVSLSGSGSGSGAGMACLAAPPQGAACLAALGAGGSAATPLLLQFVVAGGAPAAPAALLAGGYPSEPRWVGGAGAGPGEGIVCSISSSASGAGARYAPLTALPPIPAVHLPVAWTLAAAVLTERSSAPGVFVGVGGAGAGLVLPVAGTGGPAQCSGSSSSDGAPLVATPWSNSTLTSPQCATQLAALCATVAASALLSPVPPQPTLSLPMALPASRVLVVLAGVGGVGEHGGSSALPLSSALGFSSLLPAQAGSIATVNWASNCSSSASTGSGAAATPPFTLASLTLQPLPSGTPSTLALWRGGDSRPSWGASFSAIAAAALAGGGTLGPLPFAPLALPHILPTSPIVGDWTAALTPALALSSPSHLLPPSHPLHALAATFGAPPEALAPTLFPPSSGALPIAPCTALTPFPASAPAPECSLPWWGGGGTAYAASAPAAAARASGAAAQGAADAAAAAGLCPHGAGGDACTPCPSGAACPGGARILPLPGFTIPWEASPASLLVPCAPPAALARCPGWREVGGAAGAFGCGLGYSGYACSLCAPSFFPQGTECLPCPAVYPAGGGGIGYVFASGLGYFLVGVGGAIVLLLALGLARQRAWQEHLALLDDSSSSALQLQEGAAWRFPPVSHAVSTALTTLAWMWLHCQPLVTHSLVTYSLLPSRLRAYLAPITALQFRGLLAPHPSCFSWGVAFQGFWLATAVIAACYAALAFTTLPRLPGLGSAAASLALPTPHLRRLLHATSLALVTHYGALANTLSEPLNCIDTAMAASDYLALPTADGTALRASPLYAAALDALVAGASASAGAPIPPSSLDVFALLKGAAARPAAAATLGVTALLRSPMTVPLLSTPGYVGMVCNEGGHAVVRGAAIAMSALFTAGFPALLLLALLRSGRIPSPMSGAAEAPLSSEPGLGEDEAAAPEAVVKPPRTPSPWDPYVRAWSDCDVPPSAGWWLRPMDLLVLGGLSALPVLLTRTAPLQRFAGLTALGAALPLLHLAALLAWAPLTGPSGGRHLHWKAHLKCAWLLCAAALAVTNFFLFWQGTSARVAEALAYVALAIVALAGVLGLVFGTQGFALVPAPQAEELAEPAAPGLPEDALQHDTINPLHAEPEGAVEGGGMGEEGAVVEGDGGGSAPSLEEGDAAEASTRAEAAQEAPFDAVGQWRPKVLPLPPLDAFRAFPALPVSPTRRFASSIPLTASFLAAIGVEEGDPALRRTSPSERVVSLRALKTSATSHFARACRSVDLARAAAQEELARTAALWHAGGSVGATEPAYEPNAAAPPAAEGEEGEGEGKIV